MGKSCCDFRYYFTLNLLPVLFPLIYSYMYTWSILSIFYLLIPPVCQYVLWPAYIISGLVYTRSINIPRQNSCPNHCKIKTKNIILLWCDFGDVMVIHHDIYGVQGFLVICVQDSKIPVLVWIKLLWVIL